jgi:hypothetical protein
VHAIQGERVVLESQIGLSQITLAGVLGVAFFVYMIIRALIQQKPRVRFVVCLSIFVPYSLIQVLAFVELLTGGYDLMLLFMLAFYLILILDLFHQAYRIQRNPPE